MLTLHQANEIEQTIIPSHAHAESPLDYISALLSNYEQQAYLTMETGIFPSYFHGKCQLPNGPMNPPGCPNPDCPIVCGTPGSLIHFYARLRRIAFTQTRILLEDMTKPDSKTYKRVEKTVLNYANRPIPRMLQRKKDFHYETSLLEKRAEDAKEKLAPIMRHLSSMLSDLCGGLAGANVGVEDAVDDELPNCSWKDKMTGLILSYP